MSFRDWIERHRPKEPERERPITMYNAPPPDDLVTRHGQPDVEVEFNEWAVGYEANPGPGPLNYQKQEQRKKAFLALGVLLAIGGVAYFYFKEDA